MDKQPKTMHLAQHLASDYISGHEQGKPHSQALENLKRWCGYGGRLRDFRNVCDAALHELEENGVLAKQSAKIVRGAKGDVARWVRERTGKLQAKAIDAKN